MLRTFSYVLLSFVFINKEFMIKVYYVNRACCQIKSYFGMKGINHYLSKEKLVNHLI